MHGSCKIALYMVLLSDVDGDILLLPVGVRHVKNARTWLPTLLYTLLQRIAFKGSGGFRGEDGGMHPPTGGPACRDFLSVMYESQTYGFLWNHVHEKPGCGTQLLRVSAACNGGTIDSHCSAVTAVMLRQAASDDSAANTAPSAATPAVKRYRLDDSDNH